MRAALSIFLVCAFLSQAVLAGEEEEGEGESFQSILKQGCALFQGTWNWRGDYFGVGRLVFDKCRVYLFPVAECNLDIRKTNETVRAMRGARGAGGATACSSCYYASGGKKDDSPIVGPSFQLVVGYNNYYDNDNDWLVVSRLSSFSFSFLLSFLLFSLTQNLRFCTAFSDDEFRCSLSDSEFSGPIIATRRNAEVDEDLALGIQQLNKMSPQHNYWTYCMSG